MAVSSPASQPIPPTDNDNNSTDGGSRQITVELNESIGIEAE
jgi:hypothetical protein